MRTLFFLALFAACGWYGWTHRDRFLTSHEGHEVVIENGASSSIERLRLTVDGETLVKESLPSNETTRIPFTINNDSDFYLIWQWSDRPGERRWHGGMVAAGSSLQRHVFRIDDAGNVSYHTEPKPAAAAY